MKNLKGNDLIEYRLLKDFHLSVLENANINGNGNLSEETLELMEKLYQFAPV